MRTLTKRQKQIFDFVSGYIAKKGLSPTFEEIRKHLRLRAFSTVHEHVDALVAKEFLTKNSNSARGLALNDRSGMIKIPFLGTIAAGQPIEAIREREVIAIPQSVLHGTGNFYALRVVGNSMIEENINDGDVVLVKQQDTANNGQRVVALIDNYGTTLKKFYKEKGRIRLQPANRTMDPIIIPRHTPFTIQGIVIDVIKNDTHFVEAPAPVENTKRNNTLPLNQIILNDAVEELRKLPNACSDVIIIDPPYNIGKDFGNNLDKREMNEYVRWSKSWIDESIRVLKPTGTCSSTDSAKSSRICRWKYLSTNAGSSGTTRTRMSRRSIFGSAVMSPSSARGKMILSSIVMTCASPTPKGFSMARLAKCEKAQQADTAVVEKKRYTKRTRAAPCRGM
jgi:SOS regulatory protein LexA